MNIGILGTGVVAQTIGSKLVQLGHSVMLGSRTEANPRAVVWAKEEGGNALFGTFAEAAAFGEIVFNCTLGTASLDALQQAGAESLKGKILVDLSNPLDYSTGPTPTLSVCNTDSLGEQIQRAYPETRVVKTLNTMNVNVMVNPTIIHGDHDVFVSGNDIEAKATVINILKKWFGWHSVVDLGDITTSRGVEMLIPLWLRLWGVIDSSKFNFKIVS